MIVAAAARPRALLVRAGARRCALPLEAVVETLRPARLTPLAGLPPCVLGAAPVRGEPLPVVDLACLLGAAAGPPRRLVVVRGAGGRRAALAVTEVLGLGELLEGDGLAPLLAGAAAGALAGLSAADAELLAALAPARLVPEEAFAAAAAASTRGRPGSAP